MSESEEKCAIVRCLIAKTCNLVPGDLVRVHHHTYNIIILGETPEDYRLVSCMTPRYFLYLGSAWHNNSYEWCSVFLNGDKKFIIKEVSSNYIKSIYTKVNHV